MTDETRCEVTELPKSSCAHCQPPRSSAPVLRLSDLPGSARYRVIDPGPSTSSRVWAWQGSGGYSVRPIRCDHDHDDGAILCPTCTSELAAALDDVPALVEDLATQIRRDVQFVRHGTRPGDGDESPLPYDQRASAARARLTRGLAVWTGRDDTTVAARWARQHLPDALRHPRAAWCVSEVTAAIVAAHAAIDRPRDMIFVGVCECGADLWAERSSSSLTCRCGRTHDVQALQAAALAKALDQMFTLDQLVAVVTISGEPVTRATLREWVERDGLPREERIDPYWRDGVVVTDRHVWVYRLGDVLDRARQAEEEATALTTADVARRLHVAPSYVPVLVQRGELAPIRPGAKPLRFTVDEVRRYESTTRRGGKNE